MPSTPRPREDGAHLTELWSHLLWELRLWRPGAGFDADVGQFAMRLLGARMLADFDPRPARALLEYDAVEALARVAVPTLALTADGDPLRDCHERVLELVPSAEGHVFAGDHPVHDPDRAGEYFDPVRDRMAAAGLLRGAPAAETAR